MIDKLSYTSAITESLLESQLKLKILHWHSSLSAKNREDIEKTKTPLVRISLKILFSLELKKVLSSKRTNRIIDNFFKLWSYSMSRNKISKAEQNKSVLDPNYNATLKINSLYEFYSKII